jgi:anti-sigma regulatory factor (Ser/Thr protein kinase)
MDSSPTSLGDARRQVRDAAVQAGMPIDDARNLEVAVGEALANVHHHAYTSRVGPVFIEMLATDTALVVHVIDNGRATAAPAIPDTLPGRTMPGGRGLYLIKHLVDDVDITVNAGGHGVAVRMTTRLSPEQGRMPERNSRRH